MNASKISASASLNDLLERISQTKYESVVATLLSILNEYVKTTNQSNHTESKYSTYRYEYNFFDQQEGYVKYLRALNSRFSEFCHRGFGLLSPEAKKIDLPNKVKSKRKAISYLSLRFHIENIGNFVDLLCFREVLMLIEPDISKKGLHFRNNFGKIVGKMVAHLNSEMFLKADRIRLIFEKRLSGFVKEFITEMLTSEDPYIENEDVKDKTKMKEIVNLIDTTSKLQLEVESEKRWYRKFLDYETSKEYELFQNIGKLRGDALKWRNEIGVYHYAWELLENKSGLLGPYHILKFHYLFNAGSNGDSKSDKCSVNPSDRLRDLFSEFDKVFYDKPYVINFYLNQLYQEVYKIFPDIFVKLEIEMLDRNNQVHFLSKCDEIIFPPGILRLIADYIALDNDVKGMKSLMPSANTHNSFFSRKSPKESKEENSEDEVRLLSSVI